MSSIAEITENNGSVNHKEHYNVHNSYADASMTLCNNQYRIYVFQRIQMCEHKFYRFEINCGFHCQVRNLTFCVQSELAYTLFQCRGLPIKMCFFNPGSPSWWAPLGGAFNKTRHVRLSLGSRTFE